MPLIVAILATMPAAGATIAECDPDTVDVKVYLKACDPGETLGEGDCVPLANPPTDSIQGRQPVLFVHGHDLREGDGAEGGDTPHFQSNWQERFWGKPSFRDALVDGRNSDLSLEPYYLHFEDQHRSIVDDACAVAGAVRRILRRHGDPDATSVKVAIIANSKGTISSRQYLKSLVEQVDGFPAPEIEPENRFRPVSEFVAIATPNHGLALGPEIATNLYCSLALRQLNDGVDKNCTAICRPPRSSCDPANSDYPLHPACKCGDDDCEPDGVGFFRALNGEDEAPGSRAPWAPPSDGILYLTLYADRGRDFAGGSGSSGDCAGRRRAENLSCHAVNVEVPEVRGKDIFGNDIATLVHANTVHTPEVICKALYTVAHHRPPPEHPCGDLSGLLKANVVPEIPPKPVAKAADVVLLLDTSGSMGWHAMGSGCDLQGGCCSRLASAKAAARHFVKRLKVYAPETRIGVVIFPGEPTSQVLARPFTSGLEGQASFDAIAAASCDSTGTPCIGGESVSCEDSQCAGTAECPELDPVGTPTGIPIHWNGTPTRPGLEEARKMLLPKETSSPGERSRIVVLLSDGDWNRGGDPADSAFLTSLQCAGIRVYTIAMGSGGDYINEASLQAVSTGTGVENGSAIFDLGEDDSEKGFKNLDKVFERILLEIADEVDFNVDPEKSIRLGDVNRHAVEVTDHDRLMSFTVSSPRIDLLEVRVVTPDRQELVPQSSIGGSRIVDVDESLLQASPPRNGSGWQLVVSYPSNAPESQPNELSYTYSVMTRSSLNLRLHLDKPAPLTGDDLLVEARLTEENQPLRQARLELEVRRPASAIGDWHDAHRVREQQLETVPDEISGEPRSRLDKKHFLLRKRALRSARAERKLALPEVVTEPTVVLNDRGENGDRRAGDGVYSGILGNLAVPGVWDFRVVASGDTATGQSYRRERTVQKLVDMVPDAAASDVEGAIEKVRLGGSGILRLSVTPRDAAGNYLGPGYLDEIEIAVTPTPSEGLEKKDLLYGAYQRRFEVDDVTADPNVVITARGVTLYDGPLSELRKPAFRWEVSGHVGFTEPHGLSSGTRSGDLSLMAGLGYRFSRSWSTELVLGHHRFSGKAGASDLDVLEVSVNSKYSMPLGVIRVFGNGGFGHYDPDTGGSGLGWNLGGGLTYPFSERSSLDLSYNYHKMTQGAKLEFSTLHLGYRWSF